MKKFRLTQLVLFVILLHMLAVPSFAVWYSSTQIRSHLENVTLSANTIDVQFKITGKDTMQKLGCESIIVYEKVDSQWVESESIYEDDSGMSKYNSPLHTNTIYCNRDARVEYKVVVTVFAEDENGRDSRTRTFYV